MKRLIVIFYVFFGVTMYSQARLDIGTGGSVYFHFNSYKKYTDGVTYNNFTKLLVFYKDTNTIVPFYPTWKLDVKALTSDIAGENPANTLNLDFIELEASGAGTPTGTQALSDLDISLLTAGIETNTGAIPIYITYYCGVTNSLLGKEPDYYVVDLLFTLISE